MKKTMTRIAMILLAIAMAVAVAGCGDKTEPSPSPSESAPASPPASATPPAPASPSAPAVSAPSLNLTKDVGQLALDEYYYLDGDPYSDWCIFYDDGTVVDSYDEQGEYEVSDGIVSVYFDGELACQFYFHDEYTLVDVNDATMYVREGGDSYYGYEDDSDYDYDMDEIPQIIYGQRYYLNGFTSEVSFCFWINGGQVDFDDDANNEYQFGEYFIDDDEITVILDSGDEIILRIIDPVTLEAVKTNAIYTFEDALDNELVTYEYYYYNSYEDAGNLYFYADGTVDIEDPDGEIYEAEYSVDGYTVTLKFEGEEIDLEIVNGYVLYSEDAEIMFIRLP
jgi:hypothetical protein